MHGCKCNICDLIDVWFSLDESISFRIKKVPDAFPLDPAFMRKVMLGTLLQ